MGSFTRSGQPNTTRRFLGLFMVVLFCFFVSGACGLLYQVVWTRKLVLLFGTTSYAVSTVLSIFFLGLGLGSLWGGRLADRTHRPLFWYALFEIIIGLWALLFIMTINHAESMVVEALRMVAASRFSGILLRALLATGFLLLPVVLMGATLPLLARFVNREALVKSGRIGVLYTLNTLGAVTGCFISGFFLLAHFGYTKTTLLGATANVAIGIIAIFISKWTEPKIKRTPAPSAAEITVSEEDDVAPRVQPNSRTVISLVFLAFATSGFCALALEVLWTRLLTLVFLGTTYAYTTMLTTLLCGIALGSMAASLFVDRIRAHVAPLGIILFLMGITCITMLGNIAAMPQTLRGIIHDSGADWSKIMTGKFTLSFYAIFLPTFLSGMSFPFVVKAITSIRANLGRDIGKLYSANTFGGVLGAIMGGFVIIPVLGTHWGIMSLSFLLVIMGFMLIAACPATMGRTKIISLSVLVLFVAGAVLKAPDDVSQVLNAGYIPESDRILFYKEGTEGTVVVSEPKSESEGTNRTLWINRVQATVTIERGVKMNRFQGVLPLVFDRDLQDVLFMCFGSGTTCGTLALTDFNRIDAVEISEDVLEAAPLFKTDNLGVLERPNVNFIIDDGRNFLLRSQNKYDLITFEPMPLAQAGVSTFYTKEYYELCLDHLTEGGLVSQWVPMHALNPDVVRSLVYTFKSVFPEYCAWFLNADLFLIGSNRPLQIDYHRLSRHMKNEKLARALDAASFHDIEEILGCFILDKAGVDAYADGGQIMSDDRPWAEFVAPKLVYERTQHITMGEIEPHVTTPLSILKTDGLAPEIIEDIERRSKAHLNDLKAVQGYYGGMILNDTALDLFMESLKIDPKDANAEYYLKAILKVRVPLHCKWDEPEKARKLVEDALECLPGDPELEAMLAEIEAQSK